MQKLSNLEYKLINKKWVIQILFVLQKEQKVSYKSIKNIIQIPKTTLNRRLFELTKYQYIEKYVYGSISKPHHTEYKITNLGLHNINNMLFIQHQ